MLSLGQMLRNRRNRHQVYSRPDYWNGKASDLEGDAVSMWPNNHLNRHYHAELLEFLEQNLGNIDGKDVLDIGCGTGRIARHLAARGARITGVDFAEKAIAIARQKSSGDNPRYEVGSMFDLPGEACYDIIVSWGSVAMACRDRAELLQVARGFHRLLRPGGRLLLLEPIHRSFLHRVLKMDAEEFCASFTEAGFHCEPVRQLHFWPARLALAYVPWPDWITTPGYHLGQAILRLVGHRGGGDYKAISARA